MEGILQKPPAQAQDVGEKRIRARRPLGLVEERMRNARRAGARMSKRAVIEQLAVVARFRDSLAERVARIPRRTAVEMRADVVDRRGQDARASAIWERSRRTLIRLRTACGRPSTRATASFSSAAACGEAAIADA